MKHLYFLLGCMLSASQIASAQALEERDVEFPSRWVNAQGEVLIQDSIQGVKSNGNLTAVEYNHFNAEGYETASEVVTFKWDGTRSNSAKDEFTYNENNELVKYDLYSWTTEWEKNTISEYYYSNSRLDSTYVSKFDSDLAEWFVNGIEVSKYDETTGALTSFTYYKRDGVYNDLRKDLMFEYSEFNQFNKPAKGQSFIGDNGEWGKYMDIAFEYDGNGNMTSIIYTRTDSEGVTSNILKTERAYNDSGQITEIVTYRNDTSTGGWPTARKRSAPTTRPTTTSPGLPPSATTLTSGTPATRLYITGARWPPPASTP